MARATSVFAHRTASGRDVDAGGAEEGKASGGEAPAAAAAQASFGAPQSGRQSSFRSAEERRLWVIKVEAEGPTGDKCVRSEGLSTVACGVCGAAQPYGDTLRLGNVALPVPG